MDTCNICTVSVTSKSPGLQCNGPCKKFYHGKCVDLTKTYLMAFKTPGSSWKCPECRNPSDLNNSVVVTDGIGGDDNDTELLNKTNAELISILKEIRTELFNLSSKYDSLSDRLNNYDKLEDHNSKLQNDVAILSNKLELMEQRQRQNNVIIQGIPESRNENIYETLHKVSQIIKCEIDPYETVSSAYRVRSFTAPSDNVPRKIVVQFNSNHMKNNFIAAARKTRKSLPGNKFNGLPYDNSGTVFFINEHLTRRNLELHHKTRLAAKDKQYKYVWVKDGAIFVRKSDTSKAIKISNENSIARL